jgi:hypothetical protein
MWRDDRLLAGVVVLVALHSVAVGLVLVLASDWAVAFGGWGAASPRFFVRQFGVFHFAIAAAYLIEYFRYGGVRVILAAKTIAVVSLAAALVVDGGPWGVAAAAVGDAVMGAGVWWLARSARSELPTT